MVGGPWTQADVNAAGTRPGLYINFIAAAVAAVSPGVRGIVGIISESDWGNPNAIVELASIGASEDAYTNDEDATARLFNLTRLCFLGGALTIKAARVMNTTNAVKATLNLNDTDGGGGTDTIRIDALYEGTFGNNLGLIIGDDPLDAAETRVQVFVENLLVHEVISTVGHGNAGFTDEIVALLTALNSPWITATKLVDGLNDLANLATETALASGANGDAVTASEFTTVLDLFSADRVNLITTDSAVAAIQTVVGDWAIARRAEGYRIIAVLGSDTSDAAATITTDAQAFNDESVVYTGPGAVMPNVAGASTTYNGATIASMVAGIIAGTIGRAVTFISLPTGTDVETAFTNAQVKTALAGGVLVISQNPIATSPGARIERGLTTLFNPTVPPDIADFRLIRTLRIVDSIGDALTTAAANLIIGVQLNDAFGQESVIDIIKDFLDTRVSARDILDNYTVVIDDSEDNSGSNLFILIGIQPIDAIEMIFTTITIN